MIKPIFGAASLGVVRVDSEEALQSTFVRVQKEMASAQIVAGALQAGGGGAAEVSRCAASSGSPSDTGKCADCALQHMKCSLIPQAGGRQASSWIKTTLMLEEYLDGPEVRPGCEQKELGAKPLA